MGSRLRPPHWFMSCSRRNNGGPLLRKSLSEEHRCGPGRFPNTTRGTLGRVQQPPVEASLIAWYPKTRVENSAPSNPRSLAHGESNSAPSRHGLKKVAPIQQLSNSRPVAQFWLERYLDTVEVSGSSPLGPTIQNTYLQWFRRFHNR